MTRTRRSISRLPDFLLASQHEHNLTAFRHDTIGIFVLEPVLVPFLSIDAHTLDVVALLTISIIQALGPDAQRRIIIYCDINVGDPQGSLKEGRSALDDWIPLGYVSADRNSRAVSKTVEYALNDFAVSQIAAGEAPDERDIYFQRSSGWQLSWDAKASSRNFTGFVMPRYANGTFHETYNITNCGDCNWSDESYEVRLSQHVIGNKALT